MSNFGEPIIANLNEGLIVDFLPLLVCGFAALSRNIETGIFAYLCVPERHKRFPNSQKFLEDSAGREYYLWRDKCVSVSD